MARINILDMANNKVYSFENKITFLDWASKRLCNGKFYYPLQLDEDPRDIFILNWLEWNYTWDQSRYTVERVLELTDLLTFKKLSAVAFKEWRKENYDAEIKYIDEND